MYAVMNGMVCNLANILLRTQNVSISFNRICLMGWAFLIMEWWVLANASAPWNGIERKVNHFFAHLSSSMKKKYANLRILWFVVCVATRTRNDWQWQRILHIYLTSISTELPLRMSTLDFSSFAELYVKAAHFPRIKFDKNIYSNLSSKI